MSSATGNGSLLIEPKYADFELRCGDRVYRLHRAIVCQRSAMIARLCDTALEDDEEGVIEENTFDCLTLERMLQFVYQGAYTVSSIASNIDIAEHGSSSEDGYAQKRKYVPPHLRDATKDCVTDNASPTSSTKPTNLSTMISHAHVYGIADHYEIPDLKDLALDQFVGAVHDQPSLSKEEFLSVTKAIYRNTKNNNDPLRDAFRGLLLGNHLDLFIEEDFSRRLAGDDVLSDLVIAALSLTLKRKHAADDQVESDKTVLQTELDSATEDITKYKRRFEDLEQALADSNAETQKCITESLELEKEHDQCKEDYNSQVTANSFLTADLDKANEDVVKFQMRINDLKKSVSDLQSAAATSRSEIFRLENELRASQLSRIDAEKNAEKHLQLAQMHEATLKSEMERANSNFMLCGQKDAIIKDKEGALLLEKAKAERSVDIIKSIVCLINDHSECRHCGEELNYLLAADDRTAGYPFNSMLRCTCCRTKEYGDYIA